MPLDITRKQRADHPGCDVKVVNRIVNGRTSVSAARVPRPPMRMESCAWTHMLRVCDIYCAYSITRN